MTRISLSFARSASVLLLLLLLLTTQSLRAANAVTPDAADPVLAFEGKTTVKASNVTPGTEVVFFAVGLAPMGWESKMVRWSQAVTDDDRDGVVSFDAGRDIPCRSIWVVADVRNGHFTVAAPPACHLRRKPFDKKSLRKNGKGELELFLHARPYLDLLYVHPGKGAWVISAADSHPTDADGESNGVTAIALSKARTLSGNGPATDFAPGGIVVAVDLYMLDVVAERLDAQSLAEVQQ